MSLMWHPTLLRATVMQGSCSDIFDVALYSFEGIDFMTNTCTLLFEFTTSWLLHATTMNNEV